MAKIISSNEARSLVINSEKRKEELIRVMNNIITENAGSGLQTCNLPHWLSQEEKDWLSDTLVVAGYRLQNGQVMW